MADTLGNDDTPDAAVIASRRNAVRGRDLWLWPIVDAVPSRPFMKQQELV